ncbi:MAG: polysaccharide deacetylase family protein [Fibrobacter sp.]|jgi:peptidoglycan/xylan/chitin deacetylase (PgdA/CDA1 family)|nr:polysaccharide deacetylase family protein [Fibrobacter sp.]
MILAPTLLSIFLGPVFLGGMASLLFGYQRHSSRKPGLLFHSILDKPQRNMSQYSTERFRSLLAELKKNSLSAVSLKQFSCPGEKTGEVLLTFDDGFENIYRNAIPALEDCGFKASIFCVAGFVGRDSTWDVYRSSRQLTKSQISEISSLGHEIGSHTLTHANLPYLSSSNLEKELRESKQRLEDITGRAVTSISFPYGSCSRRVWDKVKETGYTQAALYRRSSFSDPDLYPVYGVYRLDRVNDVMERLLKKGFCASAARARMMSHFSKGSPVWKFREEYITVL